MSFAKEVKDEISKVKAENCCKQAEMSALLGLASSVYISSDNMHLEFSTTNLAVARRFVELIKGLYSVTIEMLTKKREKLDKATLYIIRVIEGSKPIIAEHNLISFENSKIDFVSNECCKRAYLRGAFLACGSVNSPTGSYHLEIAANGNNEAVFIQRLMNDFDLNAKISKRRTTLIVYLKEAEKITDFLNLIGAKQSFFFFEDVRIKRDFNNSINRVINCEVANLQKTLEYCKQQLKDIELIEKYTQAAHINEKMAEAINLRKRYPEMSLNDLVNKANEEFGYTITKSGLNHRFRKLHELAVSLKENR